MSRKSGPGHRVARTNTKRSRAATRQGKVGSKWPMFAVAGTAVAGALLAIVVLAQPREPVVLVQKCSRCHVASKLLGLNLDPSSAMSAVDGMVGAGRVTLTPQERAAAIAALSGR